MRNAIALVGSVLLITASGCTSPPPEEGDGPPNGDLDLDVDLGPGADTLSSVSTFFQIRRDTRTCAPPACGGFFVKRVNQTNTRCIDGKDRKECQVAEADFAKLKLDADELQRFQGELLSGRGLIRGSIAKRTGVSNDKLGKMVVSEGWQAATAVAPTGKFAKLVDKGTTCPKTPCFSFHHATLNTTDSTDLSAIDLTKVGATIDLVVAARTGMKKGGILIAGKTETVSLPGPDGKRAVASQFYLRVVHRDLSCDGLTATTCIAGEVCDITLQNACSGPTLPGICKRVPTACPGDVNQVCGCDGVTYGNDCERLRAQAQIDHAGPCAIVCGGPTGVSCPSGQMCNIKSCAADATGICEPAPPDPCPALVAPVCACTGQTFENDCIRRTVGVAFDRDGVCF